MRSKIWLVVESILLVFPSYVLTQEVSTEEFIGKLLEKNKLELARKASGGWESNLEATIRTLRDFRNGLDTAIGDVRVINTKEARDLLPRLQTEKEFLNRLHAIVTERSLPIIRDIHEMYNSSKSRDRQAYLTHRKRATSKLKDIENMMKELDSTLDGLKPGYKNLVSRLEESMSQYQFLHYGNLVPVLETQFSPSMVDALWFNRIAQGWFGFAGFGGDILILNSTFGRL